MSGRPVVLIAMSRVAFDQQFDQSHLGRLREIATLSDPPFVSDLDARSATALTDVEVMFTSWGTPTLDRSLLERMPRLRAVLHCAGTVKQLVTDDFWSRGILLTNAADVNAIPVAEFTFASILLAGKKAPFLSRAGVARQVLWPGADPHRPFGPASNYGQEIGIIGFSRIGRLVVERIARSMHPVTCWVVDPYASAEAVAAAGGRLTSLEHMLDRVSIVSLHAPALAETHHLLGAAELASLRDHATIINTARGSLIDTAALEAECATGRLNAVLDVTDPEPLPADSVLHALQNVSITPHVAGSLGTETFRMTDRAIEELERYIAGKAPLSAVRRSELEISA
ncbi:hydroxyacid dehydrogenase [Microbacterium sp. DT81.1]|uniref:hydroxyacid dehydrogenase n=1 Tax=Microbacterium sp. DT81.1 TaxID=3393413 RepID=UPI003CEF5473